MMEKSKNKKILIISMIIICVIAAFVASCDKNKKQSSAQRGQKRELSVSLLVDVFGDLSYNDGMLRELRQAETRYRNSEEIDLYVNAFEIIPNTNTVNEELSEAFETGGELFIIANQMGLPLLEPAVAYYPEKRFILVDMEVAGPNTYCALFLPGEASYLCGALAAMMSKTGIIGIMIGMNLPVLHDFAVGYIQGALYVNPNCKIIVSTVGNFHDTERAYELARDIFEQKVDVLFPAAGGAGLGALKASAEFGVYAIGVDIDQAEHVDAPMRDYIITSCLKNFDTLISTLLNEYIEGTLEFGSFGRYGLREGAVGIARNRNYQKMVPQKIQDEIDNIEQRIATGAIRVRSAFEMTQTEITELVQSVRP